MVSVHSHRRKPKKRQGVQRRGTVEKMDARNCPLKYKNKKIKTGFPRFARTPPPLCGRPQNYFPYNFCFLECGWRKSPIGSSSNFGVRKCNSVDGENFFPKAQEGNWSGCSANIHYLLALSAIPSRALGLEISPQIYRILLRWWLGMPIAAPNKAEFYTFQALLPFLFCIRFSKFHSDEHIRLNSRVQTTKNKKKIFFANKQ